MPRVPGNSSRVPRLRSRGSSLGAVEVEAFRLVRASWWVGGAEAAWPLAWLPARYSRREVVVLMDVRHSWSFDAKGQDHFTSRDDQIIELPLPRTATDTPACFCESVHHLDRCKGCVSVGRRPTCPIVSPAMFGAFVTRQARTRALDKLSTNTLTPSHTPSLLQI